MSQSVSTNRIKPFRYLPGIVLLVLVVLLTACFGGGGDNAAPETTVTDPAAVPPTGSLTCSPDCLNQGQCGTAADGRIVILAHDSRPATRDHNVILANDSAVNILAQEQHSVQDAAGNIFPLIFYVVQPAQSGPNSWVAGSCVNQTVQP